jgi:hypothetical protein
MRRLQNKMALAAGLKGGAGSVMAKLLGTSHRLPIEPTTHNIGVNGRDTNPREGRRAESLRSSNQIIRLYRLALDLDNSVQRLGVEVLSGLSAKHWRRQRSARAWGIGFAPLGFR